MNLKQEKRNYHSILLDAASICMQDQEEIGKIAAGMV